MMKMARTWMISEIYRLDKQGMLDSGSPQSTTSTAMEKAIYLSFTTNKPASLL
jgi:hypothetical protein